MSHGHGAQKRRLATRGSHASAGLCLRNRRASWRITCGLDFNTLKHKESGMAPCVDEAGAVWHARVPGQWSRALERERERAALHRSPYPLAFVKGVPVHHPVGPDCDGARAKVGPRLCYFVGWGQRKAAATRGVCGCLHEGPVRSIGRRGIGGVP